MSNIRIDIASEFKDKGFKAAEKRTTSLNRKFDNLAKTAKRTFVAIAGFKILQSSVRAFAAEDAAVKKLTQNLNNLGLAYNIKPIERFISATQAATGVNDEQLRPAMTELLTVTMDVQKSMDLLSTALDISAGTGADLSSVITGLTRAYNGNYTSIGKLQRVYTSAELKAMGFEKAVSALSDTFGGTAAANADSYQGKLDRLAITIDEAKESIGKGLVDAFTKLADGDFDKFLERINGFAESLASNFNQLAYGIALTKTLLDPRNVLSMNEKTAALKAQFFPTNQAANNPAANRQFLTSYKQQLALQKKVETQRANASKLELANQKKTQQLKRAGTVFDMENIQIVAALQGKVTEEQRLRLLALLAINNDMADAADKLTQAILAVQSPAFNMLGITISASDNATTVVEKLIKAQTQLFLLAGGIKDIPKAKNPFEDWDSVMKTIIGNLDTIAKKIKELPTAPGTLPKTETTTTTVVPIIPVIPGGGVPGGGVPGYTDYASTSTFPGDISVLTGSTIDALIADAYVSATMAGYGNTSLTSSANVLSSARLSAQLLAIQTQNKQTNDLAAARLEGQYQAIASLNKQTNDLAAQRYALMQKFYGGGSTTSAPSVVVNVAGNVTTQNDLVTAITESLYDFQKQGGNLTLSSVSI